MGHQSGSTLLHLDPYKELRWGMAIGGKVLEKWFDGASNCYRLGP